MILRLEHIAKTFKQGEQAVHVFRNLNLEVNKGESWAIWGPSGSGKSTLLSLIAGLDRPTEGKILVDGTNIAQLSEEKLTRFRAQNLGIIFQQYHLFSHLTALENVSLPLEISEDEHAKERAVEILKKVGLGNRLDHYPHQLSGGENQRVAFARAFVIKPKILLADEPSGSLDAKTGETTMNLLFDLVQTEHTTLLLVTHNPDLAKRCSHQFRLDT